jgi:hypothetical protein
LKNELNRQPIETGKFVFSHPSRDTGKTLTMIPPMRPSVKTLASILTPDTDLLLVGLRLKW